MATRLPFLPKTKKEPGRLLCLTCRDFGHVAQDCSRSAPKFKDQKWTYSNDRQKFLAELPTPQTECARCERLNLPSLFEGQLEWTSARDLQISSIRDSPHYRSLGQVGKAMFRDNCSVCVALFACTPSPESLTDEIHIVSDWMVHRMERLIKTDSDERHRYEKCLVVQLASADGEISLDEQRGDALGLLKEGKDVLSLTPQIIDARQLNIDLLKRWLSSCETNHTLTCTPKRSTNLHDILLIDVKSRRLVRYPGPDCEFLTLSYVWGNLDQARFGPYDIDEELPELPQAIENAMELCHDLGKQYLWVDSVSINQKDEQHKAGQIQKMSNIYRDAYVCIVSMCGSSMNDGLARVKPDTKTPQPQLSCSSHGKTLIGLGPTLSQQTHNTTWGKRSWTLQEALLSHRCIYVTDHQVYFECNAMQCCESIDESKSWIHTSKRDLSDEQDDRKGDKLGHGTLRNTLAGHGKPRDHQMIYGTLVTLYSFREMSKTSDALNAFSGILDHLRDLAYNDGFFWGLPIETFKWSLLWCPQSGHTRRRPFPAWSWAGWHGYVHPGWPADVYTNRSLKTPFLVWKASNNERIPLLSIQDEPEFDGDRPKTFNDIFQVIGTQIPGPDFPGCDLVKAEREGYLFIDCVIVKLHFKLKRTLSRYDYGPFNYCEAIMNGVSCLLRLTWDGPKYYLNREETQSSLVLVGRELIYGRIYLHFLQLEIEENGFATRKSVLMLEVPQDRLEALEGMQMERRRLILV